MEIHDVLASQVGRISFDNDILASCFPVSRNVIVTCYHTFQNIENESNIYNVYWPKLSLIRTATIITNEISSKDDIAFLTLNESLPQDVELLRLGFHHRYDGSFISFGYRKISHYDGLYTSGKLLGEIRAVGGRQLIQLQTNAIDRGMSGAPVFDQTYGTIVGMISEYWATQNITDNSLAFAIPINRLISVRPSISAEIPDLIAAPKDIESGLLDKTLNAVFKDYQITNGELIRACVRLALLVSADQLFDGAWGRSLWKETGVKYTTDVADKEYVKKTHTKKALSATSWAAQALAKTSGSVSLLSIKKATEFTMQHRDKATGAFGNIYAIDSGTPLVSKTTVIRSPRHTASGIKLLELSQGISHDVVKGFEFIIKNECDGGGWGEAIGDEPNTLATAYVLDALIKLMQIPTFKNMLSFPIASTAKPVITRGITWLIEQRDDDGLWKYSNSSEYKPLYSAHVLGFTPQLATYFRDETIASLDALIGLTIKEGIPATWNGEADFTTTALCLYAMLRIDPNRYKIRIQEYVSWLVRCVLSDEWLENYSCLEGIMGLVALTQLPNMPRAELSANLDPILGSDLIDKHGLTDDPNFWLEIDRQYNLGIGKTIERMYI